MNWLCYWIAILLGHDRLIKSKTGEAILFRAYDYDMQMRSRRD